MADDTAEENIAYTAEQHRLFVQACSALTAAGHEPGIVHCDNSAGVMLHPDWPEGLPRAHCMARPGIILYGFDPSDEVRFGLFRPVMKLKTVVSMVKVLQPGQSTSYGRRFTAERPTPVAGSARVGGRYGGRYAGHPGNLAGTAGGMGVLRLLGRYDCGLCGRLVVKLLRTAFKRLPSALVHIKTVLLYPVASLAVVGFMMVFLVNAPLGRFNTWIYQLLASMQGGSRVVMAAVLGALDGR